MKRWILSGAAAFLLSACLSTGAQAQVLFVSPQPSRVPQFNVPRSQFQVSPVRFTRPTGVGTRPSTQIRFNTTRFQNPVVSQTAGRFNVPQFQRLNIGGTHRTSDTPKPRAATPAAPARSAAHQSLGRFSAGIEALAP